MELPQWLGWDALQRTQFTYIRHAVVIAVLTVAAAFGGLDSAPTFQTVRLGAAYSNGPLKITILSLTVGCRSDMPLSNQPLASNGLSLVSLEASIQNTVDEDVPIDGYDQSNVFSLDGVDPQDLDRVDSQAASQQVYRTGTSDAIKDIPAGFIESIIVIWTVPENILAESPTLTVRIFDLEKVQRAILPSMHWATTSRNTGGLLTIPKTKCEQ